MNARVWIQAAYLVGLAILSVSVHLYGPWRIGGVAFAILYLSLLAPLLSLASIGYALVDARRKRIPLWATLLIVAGNVAFAIWFATFLFPALMSV